ncbi:hypothetical protein BOTNAR_0151g00120 [Botryotinia narcissicola]|uniref:Extracellular membrane protein CFEM domain-containing protein n=1 Tax=Botryotinia narcissicola TaxID=278944 RepID=A0A4Z1IEM2_9HELO|nr:hypothetical protein BOTNAR_0151g00120 [Botryotinia narcissicola]
MHFSKATLSFATLVSYAATTTTLAATGGFSGACEAQNVLEACVSSTTAIAQACQSTDYLCLCTSWNSVLTCYNVCPNDTGYTGVLANKQAYCNDAVAYASTTTSSAISKDWSTTSTASDATATATGAGSGSGTTTAKAQTTGGSSSSNTASAAESTGSNQSSGAGERVVGVNGMMAVLGGMAAVGAAFF